MGKPVQRGVDGEDADDVGAATDLREGADAVVVAIMGHGDEDALSAALTAGAGYVGLVASSRRAGVVLGALGERGLDEEALARIRSPAGLDLGPLRQEEIAVAILAELVAWRHERPRTEPMLVEAVDPLWGMTVAIAGATETAVHDGVTYYFCSPGFRRQFESDPAAFLAADTDLALIEPQRSSNRVSRRRSRTARPEARRGSVEPRARSRARQSPRM